MIYERDEEGRKIEMNQDEGKRSRLLRYFINEEL